MDTEQTLTFPGRFESLAAIGEFISRAAEDAGLDADAAYAVQVAVDEACTNIIEHGYSGEGQGDVECTCRIDDDGLTVVLRDQGCPFDPSCAPPPDLDAKIEDRSNSGLGIYLMHQLMDEVRFQRSLRTGNVLTMVKHKGIVS
jgi:anti-sigma regulatory factor (Ser/Thr protein kinase)